MDIQERIRWHEAQAMRYALTIGEDSTIAASHRKDAEMLIFLSKKLAQAEKDLKLVDALDKEFSGLVPRMFKLIVGVEEELARLKERHERFSSLALEAKCPAARLHGKPEAEHFEQRMKKLKELLR